MTSAALNIFEQFISRYYPHSYYEGPDQFNLQITHPNEYNILHNQSSSLQDQANALYKILQTFGITPQNPNNAAIAFSIANTPQDYAILVANGFDINQKYLDPDDPQQIPQYLHENGIMKERYTQWIGLLVAGYNLCNIDNHPVRPQTIHTKTGFVLITGDTPKAGLYSIDIQNQFIPLFLYSGYGIDPKLALTHLIEAVILNFGLKFDNVSLKFDNIEVPLSYIAEAIKWSIKNKLNCDIGLEGYIRFLDDVLSKQWLSFYTGMRSSLQAIRDSLQERFQHLRYRYQLTELSLRPPQGQFPGGSEYRTELKELSGSKGILNQIAQLNSNSSDEEILKILQAFQIHPQIFRNRYEAMSYLKSYLTQY